MSNEPDLDSESDDDFGLDSSILKMSEEAMKMLDAEIDQVAEMTSPKNESLSPSSSCCNFGLEKEKDKVTFQFENDDNNKNETKLTIESKPSGDDSDDSSILEELHALQMVSKQIEEELNEETVDSMQSAMAQIGNTPAKEKAKRIILQDDDKEIIDRILEDENKKYKPTNQIEKIVWRIRQEGLSANELTYVLSTLCVLVWSIVFSLMQRVMHAEL